MNENTNGNSAVQGKSWLTYRRATIISLLVTLLTLLWATDIIKFPKSKMTGDPFINFHATSKKKLAFDCNQKFLNEAHGTGRVYTPEAYILPVNDDQPIAHYIAYDYATKGDTIPCGTLVLRQDADPVSGKFDYTQVSADDVTWKAGNYRLELIYHVESKLSDLGVGPSEVKVISDLSLSEPQVKEMNNLKGKPWKRDVVRIDLSPR